MYMYMYVYIYVHNVCVHNVGNDLSFVLPSDQHDHCIQALGHHCFQHALPNTYQDTDRKETMKMRRYRPGTEVGTQH